MTEKDKEKWSKWAVGISLILFFIVILILYPKANAGQVSLAQGDLPYSCNSYDTISFTGGDIIYVPTGTAQSVDGTTYYYNILLLNQVVGVDVDFGTKIFRFDTAATTTPSTRQVGVLIQGSLGTVTDSCHFRGGHIYTDEGVGEETSSGKLGVYIFIARNITFDTVSITTDGHDALCVFNERGYKHVEFTGCNFTNNSESYTSREDFANGSIAFYQGQAQEDPDEGRYHLELNDCNVTRTPHAGFYLNQSRVFVNLCSLTVDAKNGYWDTAACWPGGCDVGQSSTNCYSIFLSQADSGSTLSNNYIRASPDNRGGRGIMVENCTGSETDSIVISGNDVEMFYGPNGESSVGEVRVFRLRSIDGPHTDYIKVIDNRFVSITDNNGTTTAVGRDASTLQVGLLINDVGYGHVLIKNNTAIARSLEAGTNANAAEISVWETFTEAPPLEFYGNRYISSNTIMRLADVYNGRPGKFLTFDSDTFQFIDSTSDSGIINSPVTFSVGTGTFASTDNIILDGIFYNDIAGLVDSALDTNITFSGSGEAELDIKYTMSVLVRDNGEAVSGATVTAWSNLADTSVSTDTAFVATSNGSGIATGIVKTWFESNTVADTTNYNNYLIKVVHGAMTKYDTLEVAYNAKADTVDFNSRHKLKGLK